MLEIEPTLLLTRRNEPSRKGSGNEMSPKETICNFVSFAPQGLESRPLRWPVARFVNLSKVGLLAISRDNRAVDELDMEMNLCRRVSTILQKPGGVDWKQKTVVWR